MHFFKGQKNISEHRKCFFLSYEKQIGKNFDLSNVFKKKFAVEFMGSKRFFQAQYWVKFLFWLHFGKMNAEQSGWSTLRTKKIWANSMGATMSKIGSKS